MWWVKQIYPYHLSTLIQTYITCRSIPQDVYLDSSSTERTRIVKSIVSHVRCSGGKFLEQDKSFRSYAIYYDVGDVKAMKKTERALRNRCASARMKNAKRVNVSRLPVYFSSYLVFELSSNGSRIYTIDSYRVMKFLMLRKQQRTLLYIGLAMQVNMKKRWNKMS